MKINRIDRVESESESESESNNSQFLTVDEQLYQAATQRRQTFDLHWQSSSSKVQPSSQQQTDVSHQPFNLIF